MKFLKKYSILIILFIFHTIGIIGILTPSLHNLTISLTPINLLLTANLLIYKSFIDKSFILAFSIAFFIGLLVEVIGVNTGILFGQYQYGSPLGFQIFNTPLIIGVNWFILSFSSLGIISTFINSNLFKALLSAILMVLLDLIIEPVAIKLNFWTWEKVSVPIQNYIMWFITAFIINYSVSILVKEFNKLNSFYVFGMQIYFFGILTVLY